MIDERWNMLVQQAKKNFENVNYYAEDLLTETADGLVKQGTRDVLEFTNQNGTFKVVRENKPVVLEKKMHYSHRQGDSARTEYKFSESEFSHRVRFFKEDGFGEWRELESDNLGALM